jgi:predicted PurR-regulated permease PerM
MSDEPRPSPLARRIEQNIGVIVLLLLLIGAFMVLQPFLSALAWAFVMAFSLWPVQRLLVSRLKGRRTLAAFLLSTAIAAVLVVPTLALVLNFAEDARSLAGAARRWAADPPDPPTWVERVPVVGREIAGTWRSLAEDLPRLVDRDAVAPTTQPLRYTKLGQLLTRLGSVAREWIPIVGLAAGHGVMQVLLSVFFTFFLFRDGEYMAQRLNVAAARIGGDRAERLLTLAGSTVRGVVYGILGTAIVQGAIAFIGFLIAGVPGAVLLGFLTFLASPIPVGPPLVWLPASLWLFHQGQTGWGIFMIVWGILVSSVDNVVKPLIISRAGATPFILVLCGVIGGAFAFGFIGVFLGPTLLAVTYRLVADWSKSADPAAPLQPETVA